LFSFLLLEFDFCFNWTRVDFTPQIQINKQIVKATCDSMNPTCINKFHLSQRAIQGKRGTEGYRVQCASHTWSTVSTAELIGSGEGMQRTGEHFYLPRLFTVQISSENLELLESITCSLTALKFGKM